MRKEVQPDQCCAHDPSEDLNDDEQQQFRVRAAAGGSVKRAEATRIVADEMRRAGREFITDVPVEVGVTTADTGSK